MSSSVHRQHLPRLIVLSSRLAFVALFACCLGRPGLARAGECTDDSETNDDFVSSDTSPLYVTCDHQLNPTDVVSRRLIFEGDAADGVTLDCAGATIDAAGYTIEIRSKVRHYTSSSGEPLYYDNNNNVTTAGGHPIPAKTFNGYYDRERPDNITIKNCTVKGSVRIWGLGTNGQGGFMWTSSHDPSLPDHTARARDAAPTNITFDNVQFMVRPDNGNMFYISPGTTYVTIQSSRWVGDPSNPGELPASNIYMDAESAYNVIRNNRFLTGTAGREIIAIDGSSGNTFVNNYFSGLNNGGIYLYRNCGEDGVTRIATPSYNTFVNNVFYYRNYGGSNPAIWIGSRSTVTYDSYCDKDDGIPWGSGASDWDYATHNIVAQNQIYVRSPSDMIQVGLDDSPGLTWLVNQSRSTNSPNYIMDNTTTRAHVSRKAGCYLGRDYYQDTFLQDGDTAFVIFPGPVSAAECVGVQCNDGALDFNESCSPTAVDFECNVSGNNGGCSGEVACPWQWLGPIPFPMFPIALTGTCNLETSSLSDADMSGSSINHLRVQRASDNPSDGVCRVGSTQLSSGMTPMMDTWTLGATYSCRERDSNGGDCAIRGTLYCL